MKKLTVLGILVIVHGMLCVFLVTALSGATNKLDYKFELPLGLQIITNPTSSTALTVPLGAKHAWISVRNAGVMYRDDGTAPTATVGLWLPSGFVFKVDNDRQLLQAMRFINSTEGTSTIYVSYYGDRP